VYSEGRRGGQETGRVKSRSTTVKNYIDEQPDEWTPVLRKLRALCRRELAGYKEQMAYGMPSYSLDGQVEVSFAKQSKYLTLYILKKPVLDAYRKDLAELSVGKGAIRYRRPEQINWTLVTSLLVETKATSSDIC
jgi:uncharacterized protein YdhG (YjbR/CyaY superfamily)